MVLTESITKPSTQPFSKSSGHLVPRNGARYVTTLRSLPRVVSGQFSGRTPTGLFTPESSSPVIREPSRNGHLMAVGSFPPSRSIAPVLPTRHPLQQVAMTLIVTQVLEFTSSSMLDIHSPSYDGRKLLDGLSKISLFERIAAWGPEPCIYII